MQRLTILILLGFSSLASAQSQSLAAFDSDVRAIAERIAPAVVRVVASRTIVVDSPHADELWTFIAPVDTTSGTGFVVDPGVIVTSSHLIAGAHSITVIFPDGRRTSAKVKGSDDFFQVAVLATETGAVKPLSIDADAKPSVGSIAIVFGNVVDGGGAPVLSMTGATRRAQGDFGGHSAHFHGRCRLSFIHRPYFRVACRCRYRSKNSPIVCY